MALSWNEIKYRAIRFSTEWKGDSNDKAEAKAFLEAFINVFGISRKNAATFEHKLNKLDGSIGYLNLFWKGTLVEMKRTFFSSFLTLVIRVTEETKVLKKPEEWEAEAQSVQKLTVSSSLKCWYS